MGFKYDINRYLAAHGDKIPMKSLAGDRQVAAASIRPCAQRLEQAEAGASNGPETDACKAETAYREQVRAAVNKTMDAQKIDALVYPTWSNPPRLIGDLNTPGGDNSQFFSPTTGFPVDPGADGLHARRAIAGGHHVLRPRVVGADADQIRVRLRAGDASSAAARIARRRCARTIKTSDLVRTSSRPQEDDYGDQRHAHAVLHVRSREAARDAARRVRLQARRRGRRLADLRGCRRPRSACIPAEGPTYDSGMRHQISFMCDDIHKTIAELRAKGVNVDGEPKTESYGITTMLQLPGGCDVMLYRAAPCDRRRHGHEQGCQPEEPAAKKRRRRRLGAAGSASEESSSTSVNVERLRVHAVPLPRRQRAVREHVAEMAVAARAQDLDAHHAVAAIRLGRDVLVGDRLEEARPAGARIELRVRRKQRQPAADARVDAGALVVEQRAAERPLGAVRARDRELLRRQLRPATPASVFSTRGRSSGPTSCPSRLKTFRNFHEREPATFLRFT